MKRPLVAFALVSTAFLAAGCVEAPATDVADDLTGLFVPRTEPLWYSPQTFPHPAFNFPTLSNPPEVVPNGSWLTPIPAAKLPSPIRGFEHVAQVEGGPSGRGMTVIGSIAIVPSSATYFVDISDPSKPVKIGEWEGNSRGADVIVYPDGRIVAVLATGGAQIAVLDVTDPTAPFELSFPEVQRTHKVDIVPGTPIVYNSATQEILDLSDPEHPVELPDRLPNNCHRTYFYIEPSKELYRAYCAGYEVTEIWDITQPGKPTLIKSIPMWHGIDGVPPTSSTPQTFSHFAIANEDATVLIVGDEMGGGGQASCTAHVSTPIRDPSVPTGALWFYDISDETSPELRGWISPASHFITNPDASSCTAHHGRLVPDPDGRDLLVMGYYGAGVILVDFTDPSSPRILDQWNDGTSVWEAMYYNGYVFTGDMMRGLDTIQFR